MTRRTLLGALKCAFRELRRELDTILAIAAVDGREKGLVEREVGYSAVEKFANIDVALAMRSECASTVHGRVGPDVLAGVTRALQLPSPYPPTSIPQRVFALFVRSTVTKLEK